MDQTDFFGFSLWNGDDLLDFIFRFVYNLTIIYVIGRLIYFRMRQNRDYLFTLVIINIVVFFVCYLLNKVELEIGFAFGIFALFSILRYRTRQIPIKEMTYLFISISIAIINALSNETISLLKLSFVNFSIVGLTFLLEKTWVRNELSRNIRYEKIELVKPENHELLMEDLKSRTGLNIHRFEIGRIDFLHDVARVKIYYYD